MKTCPFCAEEIQDAAIKCKHCGSMVGVAATPAVPRSRPAPSARLDHGTAEGLRSAPDAEQVAAAPVEELLRVESRLTHSFVGCVLVMLVTIPWAFSAASVTPGEVGEPAWATIARLVLQAGFFVWYAVSAGGAAKALGESGWKYVVWILAAPFLANVPIPLVSTIIGVSPLSIKFLLGGRLQTAIRDASVADLHSGS